MRTFVVLLWVLWLSVGAVYAQSPTPAPTGTPVPMLATVTTITIAPQNVTLKEGDTVQLIATGHYSNGEVQSNLPVAWSTSDQNIAMVSNVAGLSAQPKYSKVAKSLPGIGMVMGIGAGSAAITAKFANLTASTTVTVEAIPTPTPTATPTTKVPPKKVK